MATSRSDLDLTLVRLWVELSAINVQGRIINEEENKDDLFFSPVRAYVIFLVCINAPTKPE